MSQNFDADDFCGRLKALEHSLGCTRKVIAERLDIRPQTLKSYIDGAALPNAKVLAAIVSEFSVNPFWLLLGRGDVFDSVSCSNGLEADPILYRLKGIEAMLLRYGASPEEIRDAIKTALRAAEAPQENEPARDTQTATG